MYQCENWEWCQSRPAGGRAAQGVRGHRLVAGLLRCFSKLPMCVAARPGACQPSTAGLATAPGHLPLLTDRQLELPGAVVVCERVAAAALQRALLPHAVQVLQVQAVGAAQGRGAGAVNSCGGR